MVHPKQANKVCLNYNTSHKLTFIFICCHFNICIKCLIYQQVKHPQPMTAVTGKFVLKCRTTNIATLFDISLFYVYKFYFISNLTGISRILLPSPWGRGKGEGLLLCVICYFLFFIHHFTAAFIISFMPSRISSILLCFNSPLPSPPACLRIKVLSWGE